MNHSYGIITFLKDADGYKVLLVQSIGGYRSFSKGRIESHETPLQAAKREVFEETGISSITLWPNVYFDHYYSFFVKKGGLIHKKVGFFVGEVYDTHVTLQTSELKNFCRKNIETALPLLTFESDREILTKISKIIDKNLLNI